MSIQKIQAKENEKNEDAIFEAFKSNDECPECEGYGECYDPLDLSEPHKDCNRCHGTGAFYN